MKKQIVVIGLGRFGVSVATTLQSMGHDVLALDKDERNVTSVISQLTRAIQADATSEAVLKDLGVSDFDVAIIAMGSDIKSSVLCTILVKRLGIRHIIARANDPLHGSILEKIGADVVVYPERETGVRTAHGVTLRDVSDYMLVGRSYGISRIDALPYFVGHSVSDLGLSQHGKWEVALLLIQRKNEVIVLPDSHEIIKDNDVLLIAGNDERVERFLTEMKKNKGANHSQHSHKEE